MSGDFNSHIMLVDAAKEALFPCAPAESVLLSSAPHRWKGIIVERQSLEAQELPEHYVAGYGLSIAVGERPVRFGWKDGPRVRRGVLNPGEFHLLTHGEVNAPHWLDTFDVLSLVLDEQFVADVVGESASSAVEFETKRSAVDAVVAHYAATYCAELRAGCPNGSLYAETLTLGFTLHLLAHYAATNLRICPPRGKLNARQLRSVVDFVQANLRDNIPLSALAEQAHASPFHFARQFRATVGIPPHQFVLAQRVHKSAHLLAIGGRTAAEAAVESGFHDQSHLTRAFRKVFGTTPGAYAVAHRARVG